MCNEDGLLICIMLSERSQTPIPDDSIMASRKGDCSRNRKEVSDPRGHWGSEEEELTIIRHGDTFSDNYSVSGQ